MAFSLMFYLFSVLIFIDVFLLIFFIKEKKTEVISKDFNLKEVGKVLKNYKVYLVALFVMGVYMYQQGLSVLILFMNSALLISANITFIGGLLRTYLFRLFFSAPAGKIADKSRKYIKFLVVECIICSFIMTIIIFYLDLKLVAFKIKHFTKNINSNCSIYILLMFRCYLLRFSNKSMSNNIWNWYWSKTLCNSSWFSFCNSLFTWRLILTTKFIIFR